MRTRANCNAVVLVVFMMVVGNAARYPFDYTCAKKCYQCQCNDGFYCAGSCLQRTEKCVSVNSSCFNSNSCGNVPNSQVRYKVYVGWAKLRSPSLASKLDKYHNYHLQHMFIQYRGFTYELGKSYGYAELDIDDPYYKYKLCDIPNGFKTIGDSSCTRNQVIQFVTRYISKHHGYNFLWNNCQHFGNALKNQLLSNCRISAENDNVDYNVAPSGFNDVNFTFGNRSDVDLFNCTEATLGNCTTLCGETEDLIQNRQGNYVCPCEEDDEDEVVSSGTSEGCQLIWLTMAVATHCFRADWPRWAIMFLPIFLILNCFQM